MGLPCPSQRKYLMCSRREELVYGQGKDDFFTVTACALEKRCFLHKIMRRKCRRRCVSHQRGEDDVLVNGVILRNSDEICAQKRNDMTNKFAGSSYSRIAGGWQRLGEWWLFTLLQHAGTNTPGSLEF